MAEINMRFVTDGEPSMELAKKIEEKLNGLADVDQSEARVEEARMITGAEIAAGIAVTAAIVGSTADLISAVHRVVKEIQGLIAEFRGDGGVKDVQIEVGTQLVSVSELTEEQMADVAAA